MGTLIFFLILGYLILSAIYGGICIELFESYTKTVRVENGKRGKTKEVADFKYNNLIIILNCIFFITTFFIYIYFSFEDEYNHFTNGKESKIINWLFQPKNK